MPAADLPYRLLVAPTAAKSLATQLPEGVAAAVVELITGELLRSPRRVGKPLQRELSGVWAARRGVYRVLYTIDDDKRLVTVLDIEHRAHIYRRR